MTQWLRRRRWGWAVLLVALVGAGQTPATPAAQGGGVSLERQPGATPRRVVFILTDDHRYDAMGFMKASRSSRRRTMDRAGARRRALAQRVRHDGAVLAEPRVDPHRPLRAPAPRRRQQQRRSRRARRSSRSTCRRPATRRRSSASGTWAARATSRSRASTSWVSFRGQGTYLPSQDGLNVDGKRVPQKGYITDELTDYALDWLKQRAERAAVLPVPVAQGRARRVRAGRAAQGPLQRRRSSCRPHSHGRSRRTMARTGRCGCRTSATAGTASTSRTTATLDIARVLQALRRDAARRGREHRARARRAAGARASSIPRS